MPSIEVTLYCEQQATVVVDVAPGADQTEVTRAAYAKLDESGGAEWETTVAEVSYSRSSLDTRPAP